jgi:hypothetical protein
MADPASAETVHVEKGAEVAIRPRGDLPGARPNALDLGRQAEILDGALDQP